MDYYSYYAANNYLAHHGVLGMKGGVRKAALYGRTQNKLGGKYTRRQKDKMQRTAAKFESKNVKENIKNANLMDKNMNRLQTRWANALESTKKLNDINSGTLKAGRDYVTNKTVYTNLPLDAIGFSNVGVATDITYKGSKSRTKR